MAINAIKKENDDKKKAKARTPAEAAVAIVAAAFKAGNIYKDDAWSLISNWLYKLVFYGDIFFIFPYGNSFL